MKLAASVAKTIEERRTHFGKQVYVRSLLISVMECICDIEFGLKEWDATRTMRTDALDAILESLGSQLVPPDFHQASADSSLFGSQHPSDVEQDEPGPSPNSKSFGKTNSSSILTPTQSPNYSHDRRRNASGTSNNFGLPSVSPLSPSATIRRNGSAKKYGDNPFGPKDQIGTKGKGSERANFFD